VGHINLLAFVVHIYIRFWHYVCYIPTNFSPTVETSFHSVHYIKSVNSISLSELKG